MAAPKFKALNDSTLKAYKLPAGKALANEVDGEGLDIQFKRVKRDGKNVVTATWRFTYKRPASSPKAGLRNTLTLGTYPELSLAEARELASAKRGMVQADKDPGEARAAERVKEIEVREDKQRVEQGLPVRGSFKEATLAYYADRTTPGLRTTWTSRTAARWLSQVNNYLIPILGDKKLGDITISDLRECIVVLEARKQFETATKIREHASQILDFAMANAEVTGFKLERNVARDSKPLAKVHTRKSHPKIRDPKQLGQIYRELTTAPDGRFSVLARTACEIQILLWQRTEMIVGMQWSELDLEHEEGPRWTIPAQRMKLDQHLKDQGDVYDHVIPLPKRVMELLEAVRPITGRQQHVFATVPRRDVAMTGKTMIKPLRDLGYGSEVINSHGFRGTAQTICLDRLDVAWDVTEMHLAHVPKGLGRTYNNSQYVTQRRAMLEKWVGYLQQQAKGAEVLEFKRAA